MTFLYEQDVLKSLASALTKEAQQPGPIGNEIQVAKKLVARLAREVGGVPEAPNVSAETPTPVGLNTENLQNIGNLLKFLDDNQVKVDGARVAFDQAESEKLQEGEQNKLSPVTINVSRDAATRKWNTADYYVNLPALIKYVTYLQNKAKQEDNKVLSVLIGKLIDQVNTVKPDSGLSRNPKSVPGKNVNEVSDDTIIDSFGKVFDSKSLTVDNGGYVMYAKDLKNKESLNAWMMSNPEAQVITYDKSGRKSGVKYSDSLVDKCVIINALYKRAVNLSNNSQSAKDTEKYSYYIKRIQEIGTTVVGPNGQVCTVGSAYTSKPGTGGDTELAGYQTNKDQAGTGGGNINTTAQIGRIISELPLSIEDVNLDRIFSFTNELNTLISGSQGAAAGDRNNRIRGYINDLGQKTAALKSLTKHNAAIFPTNISAQEFASMLKNPANYLPALEGLATVVNLVRMVVAEFYSAYKNQIAGMSDQYKQLLRGQIGTNRDDSSIYARNIEDINHLRNKYNQVLRVK
jgi:hypothetical protein